jgi:2-dehydro-3-deoxy-D-arabinonate dehydratase
VKLVQFYDETDRVRVGVVQDDSVVDITWPEESLETTLDFLAFAHDRRQSLDQAVAELMHRHAGERYSYRELAQPGSEGKPRLTMPLFPTSVWGCGVTYKRSAEFRDADMQGPAGIYDKVYRSERPEIFYKGDTRHCAGPNEPIGIRVDSKFTAPEPELAYILGYQGEIVGYTVCDDVSAWDIERENPLYVPQSKIFLGCVALGPVLATPVDVPDPYHLEIRARILRRGRVIFTGGVNTSQIRHKFEVLTEYLTRNNPVLPGTVVSTGTGIIVTEEAALQAGDVVEIEIERIGLLSTPVRQLTMADR